MKITDMTNQRIGKLTVLGPEGKKSGKTAWACLCDCGNKTVINGGSLRNKNPTQSCGCLSKKHFVDLTGQKFNNLTLTTHLGKDNSSNNIYNCICDCGKTIVAQGSDVKTGKIKSCGCLKFKKAQDSVLENPKLNIQKQLYRDYKYKAENYRELSFDLSFEKFKELIELPCTYCGQEGVAFHNSTRKITIDYIYRYNGIDRVDNDKGYTLDNSVPCCKFCNQMKHTLTSDSFKDHITKIYNHSIKKSDESK